MDINNFFEQNIFFLVVADNFINMEKVLPFDESLEQSFDELLDY